MNLYRYANQNPTNEIDPNGLVALNPVSGGIGGTAICGPVCSGIGALAGGAAVFFAGQAIIDAVSDDEDQTQADWLREKDWADYKATYKEQPPPDLDPCERLRWKLKQEEKLIRNRQKFDVRWHQGRHDQPGKNGAPSANDQSRKAIENLKRKMRNLGCDDQCK